MSHQFDSLWRRFIDVCVERLPWDCMIDFQSRVWAAAYAGKMPVKPRQAEFAELRGKGSTSMRVSRGDRHIELEYFPATDAWYCCGLVGQALDRVLVVEFSPRKGVVTRGHGRLEELSTLAIDWLLATESS